MPNALQRLALAALLLGSVAAARAQEREPSLDVTLPPGFRIELLRAAGPEEDSWISLTFDDRGRILVGLDNAGVGRITLAKNDQPQQFERLDDTLKHCRGVLYAYDSLYVCATNSNGFYRLRDTTGDDRFDEVKLLKPMDYRSRYGHGTNQVLLGPDGMLYVVNGNDVSFPEGTDPNSPYRHPQNDKLLPNPHDAGQDDRVGHILRVDPDGEHWEVIAGGFRNQFDAAFNAQGELFTYDADMEWDAGLPWYRPTRLNHVVSAGEYGWRWGTGKWPTHYQDSLPTTLDTGFGSPTGLLFGTSSRFPERYRDALFMADWQNGRILLVDLLPHGASYRAEYDVFLKGGPLNVCDMEFGPDGALYFVTGGRGSQSGLYRVSWTGNAPAPELPPSVQIDPPAARDAEFLRLNRLQLEEFHTRKDPAAVDAAWHFIASDDRWIRFAARLAIENQPVDQWRERALAEATPWGSTTALMALARAGDRDDQPGILAALARQPLEQYELQPLLGALRVYALTFIRQGRPDDATCARIADRLNALYPHADSRANRELSELLIYLNHTDAVTKTVALLARAATQEEQIHYALTLTHAQSGWTDDARRALLVWLDEARRFSGGKLVRETVLNLKADHLAALSADETQRFAQEIAALDVPLETAAPAEPLPIVRRWTWDDLAEVPARVSANADRAAGEAALAKGSCLKCHRFGDKGGQIGPDLTRVGGRFDVRTLLESILEPSKVIDPKYRSTSYVLENGKVVTGRPVGVSAKQIVIETNPLTAETVTVPRDQIEEAVPSPASPMPTGLADVLTEDEIAALLAYLKHGAE